MAVNIIKGEDYPLKVRVTDKKSGKPYNFDGFESATASFFQEDSDEPVTLIGTNSETNVLLFTFEPETSSLLKSGDSLDFEYRWMQEGKLYIERVEGQLNVLEQLF